MSEFALGQLGRWQCLFVLFATVFHRGTLVRNTYGINGHLFMHDE